MVRAPCCEKMGLKKGPWTPDEDQLLVSYVQQHSHANWRALPKHAGLLRCGKSCRLRWINYLRPDIKRGNFSKEEEDTIINLHEKLGNKWSAIAARLPGRTDNEIKNVWHTNLKKKLQNRHKCGFDAQTKYEQLEGSGFSPQRSTNTSELSSVTESSGVAIKLERTDSTSETFPEVEEWFLLEEFAPRNSAQQDFSTELQLKFPLSTVESSKGDGNGMDFWYNLFIKAGDVPELPEF